MSKIGPEAIVHDPLGAFRVGRAAVHPPGPSQGGNTESTHVSNDACSMEGYLFTPSYS